MYTLGVDALQKRILWIAILGSFIAFLDGSIVNVALPSISEELGGGLGLQQWVVDAYLITLGSLILIAGSLSDLFGRKKILWWGLIGFAVTSLLCAIAPNGISLIIARALQGIAGAMLVPSSLALIVSYFPHERQGKAIGLWTAWTGTAFVAGPLIGGILVDTFSWRAIFAINIIPIIFTLFLLFPIKDRHHKKSVGIDIKGAILCSLGLIGPVFALIEQARFGWNHPIIYISGLLGILSFVLFIFHERRSPHPMMPLGIFKVPNFLFGNISTFFIYAALSLGTFLITIFVQQIGSYSALNAGLALLPVTIMMFALSPWFGKLSTKYGPRFFMTTGPILASIGFLLLLRVSVPIDYISTLFPGIFVFGLGLSMTVAPLTTTILEALPRHMAGIDSAINNAIARIAGLIAIAGISIVVGSQLTSQGFYKSILAVSLFLFIGGVVAFVGIRNPKTSD